MIFTGGRQKADRSALGTDSMALENGFRQYVGSFCIFSATVQKATDAKSRCLLYFWNSVQECQE